MHQQLDALLDDLTLTTVALALAIGWSLYELAHGVATFVDALGTHVSRSDASGYASFGFTGSGFTWIVHRHIVALDGIVVGLVELALVLLVAAVVRGRQSKLPTSV